MARAVASLTQRGTATVELAIALPLLLLVMLTTAEVGRLLSQYNSLTKSVRGSCRYVAANAAPGTNGLVSISPALRAQAVNLAVFGNVGGTGTALLPGLA
ncbi:MAG TPA: TadE/TadG family type IV pilus assembly protein, partial [Steroidobacteraceae bacterium]|nr:TadE/TadG family type IV pilus assembly protein [Steroidobacteraceae bacterium]